MQTAHAMPAFAPAPEIPRALSISTFKAKDMIEAVCTAYEINKRDVLTDNRHKNVVWARHVAMYTLRKVLVLSYPDLAVLFNRNHSTIMSGVRRVEAVMADRDSKDQCTIVKRTYVMGLVAGFAATDCYRQGHMSIQQLTLAMRSVLEA